MFLVCSVYLFDACCLVCFEFGFCFVYLGWFWVDCVGFVGLVGLVFYFAFAWFVDYCFELIDC